MIVLDYSARPARRGAALLACRAARRGGGGRQPRRRRRRPRPRPARRATRRPTPGWWRRSWSASRPKAAPCAAPPRGRLRLLLRLPRTEPRLLARPPAGARFPPSAAARSATWRVPRGRETDFVGAGGLPARRSVDVAKTQPGHQRRPGQRSPDPRHRLAGARRRPTAPCCAAAVPRSSRRWRGGRSPGSACRGSSAPTACEGVFPDPYVPIPAECQGPRCAVGPLPRVHVHLLGPRHRRLRRPRPELAQPAQRPAGPRKAGARLELRAALRRSTPARPRSPSRPGGLSYSHQGDGPGRHRAATLRHRAAAQPPGRASAASHRRPAPPPAPAPAPASRRPLAATAPAGRRPRLPPSLRRSPSRSRARRRRPRLLHARPTGRRRRWSRSCRRPAPPAFQPTPPTGSGPGDPAGGGGRGGGRVRPRPADGRRVGSRRNAQRGTSAAGLRSLSWRCSLAIGAAAIAGPRRRREPSPARLPELQPAKEVSTMKHVPISEPGGLPRPATRILSAAALPSPCSPSSSRWAASSPAKPAAQATERGSGRRRSRSSPRASTS